MGKAAERLLKFPFVKKIAISEVKNKTRLNVFIDASIKTRLTISRKNIKEYFEFIIQKYCKNHEKYDIKVRWFK